MNHGRPVNIEKTIFTLLLNKFWHKPHKWVKELQLDRWVVNSYPPSPTKKKKKFIYIHTIITTKLVGASTLNALTSINKVYCTSSLESPQVHYSKSLYDAGTRSITYIYIYLALDAVEA